MTNETQPKTNRPDFHVFHSEEISKGKTRLIRVGAAWKHTNGDGISLQLDSLPVRAFDGSLVLFPPRAAANETPAENA